MLSDLKKELFEFRMFLNMFICNILMRLLKNKNKK